jgi:hypothetical protein
MPRLIGRRTGALLDELDEDAADALEDDSFGFDEMSFGFTTTAGLFGGGAMTSTSLSLLDAFALFLRAPM